MTFPRSFRTCVPPPVRMRMIVTLLVGLTSACSGGSADADAQTLTVFAASSLTEAFTDLGKRFEAGEHGVDVRFQFAGSPTLARQIVDGAPADVFAAADEATMASLADESNALDAPRMFALNTLAIVVEQGNPKGIKDLHDLKRSDVTTVLCAPEVPCGSLAAQVLKRAGVTIVARSLEENVKAVIAKVALGEADAGIAYVGDVHAGTNDIEGVTIADADNLTTRYQVALLRTSNRRGEAERFVAYLGSPEGRRILADHGLMLP